VPATGADIKWLLSGGAANANPNASLGGAISTTQIVDAVSQNLFDDVYSGESVPGDVEYRGFYIKNGHATDPLTAVAIYISLLTLSASTEFDLGLAVQATNVAMATIANESTAPAGVTFTRPTTYAAGLVIGTLLAGEFKGVWIRRTVSAAAPSGADSGTLKVEAAP
jgi:hypothetical protein